MRERTGSHKFQIQFVIVIAFHTSESHPAPRRQQRKRRSLQRSVQQSFGVKLFRPKEIRSLGTVMVSVRWPLADHLAFH